MHTYSTNSGIYSVDMMIAYINIFDPDSIPVDIAELLKKGVLEWKGWGDPTGKRYSVQEVIDNTKK